MVKVLCLGEEDEADEPALTTPPREDGEEPVPDPNINNRASVALSCYPVVTQLATCLDLTSLDALSRACRRFRANLLPYRRQLISLALRCENENINQARQLADALSASFQTWTAYGQYGTQVNDVLGTQVNRLTSGKIGACARDLVGSCRRCGNTVCRNCIIKPPGYSILQGRHRRLCRLCAKAVLASMSYDASSISEDSLSSQEDLVSIPRTPCICPENVWICGTCGQNCRAEDTTYLRGWWWRTRYSKCGGFGAGLGEGIEGVECGRGINCLAAAIVEKEVECDASQLALIEAESERARSAGHLWAGNSYTTHEMVGIGGQVKVKVKKMVMVGATVSEHENERSSSDYLRLEQQAIDRSWCSWCDRVMPSKTDMDEMNWH